MTGAGAFTVTYTWLLLDLQKKKRPFSWLRALQVTWSSCLWRLVHMCWYTGLRQLPADVDDLCASCGCSSCAARSHARARAQRGRRGDAPHRAETRVLTLYTRQYLFCSTERTQLWECEQNSCVTVCGSSRFPVAWPASAHDSVS